MKISIWDILTGVTLLGIVCLVGTFGAILLNPNVSFNPLSPNVVNAQPPMIPTISLPTMTATSQGLPPTWTPPPPATQANPADQPTLRVTSTLYPTLTPVILPTFTPSRAAPAGRAGGNCSVVTQVPADGKYMTAGKAFTTTWTIKNTGKDTWRSDSIDIAYTGGNNMHKAAGESDVQDLKYDVSPNAMAQVVVDMVAPSTGGAYTENWALRAGSNAVCQFFIQIKVQ